MPLASIDTIMARLAQQDAAQKAATEKIAALAKILGPIAANMEASTAQIRRQLFNTAPSTGATPARPDVQDEAAQTSDNLLTQTLVGHNVPNPGGLDVQTLNKLAALKQSVLEINKQIHRATTSALQIDQVLAESLRTPFTQTITKVRLQKMEKLRLPKFYGISDPSAHVTSFNIAMRRSNFPDNEKTPAFANFSSSPSKDRPSTGSPVYRRTPSTVSATSRRCSLRTI